MDNLIDQELTRYNDIEVEMAVLALCMRKNSSIVELVQNKITSDDFTDKRNSSIYDVILEMYYENLQIDRITVFAELEKRGMADMVGGQRYVYRVGDTIAVQSALGSYIDALKDRSARAKILKITNEIRKDTLGSNLSASDIIDRAINNMTELKGSNEVKGLASMTDVLKSTLADIYAEMRDEASGNKIKLGYPKLDAMLGGLGPGTLHVLAARPGMGKTALAMNIATNVAANQKTVVVFSLEMTNEEIGKRMMSSAMTKSVKDIIRSRQLTDSDKQQLDRALLKMREYPIYFDESVDINPVTMKAKIQQLAASGNPPKLVIVDYLQLIELKGLKGRSRNDEVATISRGLKLLAKEFRIPVIALSQLSRKADGQVPKLSELRDSGAIEQDADTVMFVHRPNYIEDNGNTPSNNAAPATSIIGGVEAEPAYIFLAKNRHGQVGKDTVWWIPSKTLFYEHSEKDPVDPDSPYARTANADAAAQKYDFDEDKDDEQVMDPPLSEDESAGQAEEEFMADTHDDLPDGFFDEHI